MVEYITREEFEARVGVLEQEVEGEKMVTRHILEQARRNGDDLAAIKTRLGRVEEKLVGVDLKAMAKDLGGLTGSFEKLDGKVGSLIKNLPTMIADVMRDVLSEGKRR